MFNEVKEELKTPSQHAPKIITPLTKKLLAQDDLTEEELFNMIKAHKNYLQSLKHEQI
jgi:hypothetical protein